MNATERDPERPDPTAPSRQQVRESFVERRIRQAMDEGAFDDLPHRGRRLPLEDDSAAGEWASAHRILRNAGVAPPWIEADKTVRRLLAEIDALIERAPRMGRWESARARRDVARLVDATNRAIERVNLEAPTTRQHRRPLDAAAELDRFEASGSADRQRRRPPDGG
jgi:hypothetical protein